jgi:hypothetical protein
MVLGSSKCWAIHGSRGGDVGEGQGVFVSVVGKSEQSRFGRLFIGYSVRVTEAERGGERRGGKGNCTCACTCTCACIAGLTVADANLYLSIDVLMSFMSLGPYSYPYILTSFAVPLGCKMPKMPKMQPEPKIQSKINSSSFFPPSSPSPSPSVTVIVTLARFCPLPGCWPPASRLPNPAALRPALKTFSHRAPSPSPTLTLTPIELFASGLSRAAPNLAMCVWLLALPAWEYSFTSMGAQTPWT